MQIEELTAKTILEPAVFDYLFSIEDASKHNIELIDFEEKAASLRVKSKFNAVYKGEKQKRDKLKREELKRSNGARMTEFNAEYPELICGPWQCDESGVKIEYDKGTNIACYNPIMPVKRLENVETHTEKMVIAFKRDGYWREHIFDRDILSSSSRIASGISRYGAIVTSETAKHLVKYLADIESFNTNTILKQLSTSKLGWINDDFMPYVDEEIIFDSQDRFKTLYDSIIHKGSKKNYITFLKKVRQSPRIEPKVCLVASLASVLVSLCGALPFILHIYGEGGKGKTLCLMLAASVWGNTNEGGYIADPKSTQTAFEMRLNVLNNLPFICDDMGSIKKKFSMTKGTDFADFIYLVCNGRGNERSNVNLGLNYVPNWKNCSITSSEKPITNETSQGGELLRTIEIETEQGNIFNDGKGVADFLRSNFGFLGEMFVNTIKEMGKNELISLYKATKKRIEEKDVEHEKEGKQIESMTVLLTADKILTDYILKDGVYLDFDTMYDYIRTNKQMSDMERAMDFIRDKVNTHHGRFTGSDGEHWGFIDGDWTYIIPNVFDEYFCDPGNFQRNMFVKWALKNGKAQADVNRHTKTKRMYGGKAKFVCLNIKIEDEIV